MGKIVGKQFRVVASKNLKDSLADSVKEGNQAKFYLAQAPSVASINPDGVSLDDVTTPDKEFDRNVLIINGNKIQGVNDSDIIKLNAIQDVINLFVYKGSVDTFANLPTTNVKVGDVYNVNREFYIENVSYPAHTNVVCSYAKSGAGHQFITWDALGGTMQIGTSVRPHTVNDKQLSYNVPEKIPISSFSIYLAENSSLKVIDGKISLNKSRPSAKRTDNETLYYGSADPIGEFSIKVDVSQGLYINDLNMISLNISSSEGLNTNSSNALYILLATDKTVPINSIQKELCANSGLAFNEHGALTIAIGEQSSNNMDCINGALVLGEGSSSDGHGGLCISSNAMVNFINTNTSIRTYISSLIDEKLKAQ